MRQTRLLWGQNELVICMCTYKELQISTDSMTQRVHTWVSVVGKLIGQFQEEKKRKLSKETLCLLFVVPVSKDCKCQVELICRTADEIIVMISPLRGINTHYVSPKVKNLRLHVGARGHYPPRYSHNTCQWHKKRGMNEKITSCEACMQNKSKLDLWESLVTQSGSLI